MEKLLKDLTQHLDKNFLQGYMAEIDKLMAQEGHDKEKAFMQPYIDKLKKGESLDVKEFQNKTIEYARRN